MYALLYEIYYANLVTGWGFVVDESSFMSWQPGTIDGVANIAGC